MFDDDQLQKRAKSYILYLLARRDYSRSQLEKKLRFKKYDENLIAALIESLIAEGLFRETAFTKARTRQLLKKGLGASLVKSRLRFEQCPVNDVDIANAFDHMGTSPEAELRILIQKQLRRQLRASEVDFKVLTQKITKFLQLKGHRFADIKKILDEEITKI